MSKKRSPPRLYEIDLISRLSEIEAKSPPGKHKLSLIPREKPSSESKSD